jgi:hypothetical protein
MQDESIDKAWWSDLFRGSTDPASEVPADVWDSALASALDPETPETDNDLVPPPDEESFTSDLGDGSLVDDDLGYSPHDSVDHDDIVATDDVHIAHPSEGHVDFRDPEGFDHT